MNRPARLLLPAVAALALLTACLADKAPEPTPPAPCDTLGVTYAAVIAPLYERSCNLAGCHNEQDYPNAHGIALYNYDDAKDNTQFGQVICAIEHQPACIPMPQDHPKLSDCEILQVKAWVAHDCPQ